MSLERDASVRLHAYVQGRVQGVGFREFVCRHAAALGLTGWVRNLPDGRVEVVAEGQRRQVEALRTHLRAGPRLGRVDDVEAHWGAATGADSPFTIR